MRQQVQSISSAVRPAVPSAFIPQKTLRSAVSCHGIGLHTGAKVKLGLHPAPVDSGVVFRRLDLEEPAMIIPALVDRVRTSELCTELASAAGIGIKTVEHLLAAFAGLGIDNVRVDLDGPEVPVMDGSASPFVQLIERAGVVEQVAPRRYLRVLRPIRVGDHRRFAELVPDEGFRISFEIDFPNSPVGEQAISFDLDDDVFAAELGPARTFGFARDLEKLRSSGLAKGGSLANAVVVGDDGVLNEEGLRFQDEFVRHKALDALGDLYLAGTPILGHFRGFRSGHAMHAKLLRALFAEPSAWRVEVRVEAETEAEAWPRRAAI